MKQYVIIHTLRVLTVIVLLAAVTAAASAQDVTYTNDEAADTITADSLAAMMAAADTMPAKTAKALKKRNGITEEDTVMTAAQKRNWQAWTPNPQRAMWLAMVLPGAGQIYNRKYWKLPIFYGGMMGCLYAMNWNNMMYKDYSQAYLDIMDDDPTTQSYNKFLHLGKHIDSSNEERYKKLFKSRKDKYRRWRDMSFFCLVGVYALSIIDAYVDAELSEFDISKDLSLKVEPTVIGGSNRSLIDGSGAVGLQCSLTF